MIECRRSIARLVKAPAHEATRCQQKAESIRNLLRELKHSVDNFEASHSQLVALVTEYTPFLFALSHQKPGRVLIVSGNRQTVRIRFIL